MRPELGVCYYPEHWPEEIWGTDAQRMRKAGLSWVRIGEFSWSRLEAKEGVLTWGWLDRAVETLASTGLKIVMGTPSATPPRWVLHKYPDMLAVDRTGHPRNFGSRRHYCFSHIGYRKEAARMAAAMAERYGTDPAVQAWQIDNEYGCHETTLSYSAAARDGFQAWLARKYESVDALNTAWGNVFWSMEVQKLDDINLPNRTVTAANPAHWLDFRRFASDEVVAFNRAQIAAMRPHTDKPFLHNYMGRVTDFDHFDVGRDLEIAAWDSYPIGFLQEVLQEEGKSWKLRFVRQGDPDFQAFHHDLYRAVGRLWIMEQQPGPVNWATYNPSPLKGCVALWTMEAMAHGAELVSYFRWRQLPFGQEQFHAGLLRCDHEDAPALKEVQAVARELADLGSIEQTVAEVAIVFDYQSQWAWDIQPQGKGFDHFRLVFEFYRTLRRLGLNVDLLPRTCKSFGGRKLVLIPGLMAWTSELRAAIQSFKGLVIAGPRSGLKTEDMHIPPTLGPDFAGATSSEVSTLPPDLSIPLAQGGQIIRWCERLACETPMETTEDGQPIMARNGREIYLGAWLDDVARYRVFKAICAEAGVEILEMEEGVRRRTTKDKTLITNYNSHTVSFDGRPIPAAGYIWHMPTGENKT